MTKDSDNPRPPAGPFDAMAFVCAVRKQPLGVLEALADELAVLHAEIAALKARLPEPARETGWAVVDEDGDPLSMDNGFCPPQNRIAKELMWFDSEAEAVRCAEAITAARYLLNHRAALLYKDTLREVE